MKKNHKLYISISVVIVLSLAAISVILLPRSNQNNNQQLTQGDIALFYAGKNIRFIVPATPGGGLDEYARMLVPFMEKYTGARINVTNLPGAGGMRGANELFYSPKNGLVIGIMNGLAMVTNRLVGIEGAEYVIEEYKYLGRVVADSRVMSVSVDNDLMSIDDVWNAEQTVKLGATGLGGSAYVDGVISKVAFGMNVQIIHGFDSSAVVRQSMLRGNIDGAWGSYGSAEDGVNAGLERIILQSGRNRSDDIPDVPAVFEFINMTVNPERTEKILSAWDALISVGRPVATSPGTADEKVEYLQEAFKQAMHDPEFILMAERAGRQIDYASADELMEIIMAATQMEPDIEALFTKAVRGEL